ncbi:MAG: hypothetical protein P9M03_00010, partial [Candidatus Theseobacter exili]|nr:hypothetical protein [Candidatus Theseobacter exili]
INTDPRFMGIVTPAKVELKSAKTISAWSDYYYDSKDILDSRPALVENSFGKGKAFLVTVFEYPAHPGMMPFSKDIIRTILAGEQGGIRIQSNDRVRYAVYSTVSENHGKTITVIYFLNTDSNNDAIVKLWSKGKKSPSFIIAACEMKIAYLFDDIIVIPENRHINLKKWLTKTYSHELAFYSLKKQDLLVFNSGKEKNDINISCQKFLLRPEASKIIKIKRLVNPNYKNFYASDFLEEPYIKNGDPRTPY